jgi:hypothetical protein
MRSDQSEPPADPNPIEELARLAQDGQPAVGGSRMKQPTVDEMRRHIESLLEKYEITFNIECRRPVDAWAVRCEFEEVSISAIKSVLSYATALHEIGHIRGHYQTSRGMVVRERWAWRWAQLNALV